MKSKKDFFNRLASSWNDIYCDRDIHCQLDYLIREFQIRKGDVILDTGCGTGIIAEKIISYLNNEVKVLGIDFSLEMLKKADVKGAFFMCCDAHDLAFKESCFDKVIFFSCFPHFDRKQDIIRESKRVLKENGAIFISHLLSSQEIEQIHRDKHASVSKDIMPSKQDMIEMFQSLGMKVSAFKDEKGLYFLKAEK